jgi:hypothetical protein
VRADGSFDAPATAGRARVRVRGAGFLDTSREVAVGEALLAMPYRLARKATAQRVGAAGASLRFQEAQLEIPRGAFPEGTLIALTYLGRARVAAVSASAQFVDADQIPRRAVAAVTLEPSQAGTGTVRVRVPVPLDATMDSVRAFPIDDDGHWGGGFAADTVAGGMAELSVAGAGRFGVAVDARRADGRRVGYVVVEPGDGAMESGNVLPGGNELTALAQPLAVVDPWGSRLEVAPAGRMRLMVPAPADAAAQRVATAPYSGQGALLAGRARVVVPALPDRSVKLELMAGTTTFQVRGTAFTLTTCPGPGGAVDTVELVEGSLDATFAGKTATVAAGEVVTFCTSCGAGQAPSCGAGTDAAPPATDVAAPLDRPPPDAGAPDTSPPDAALDARQPDAAAGPLVITPGSADYGAVDVGASLRMIFTVTNRGRERPGCRR